MIRRRTWLLSWFVVVFVGMSISAIAAAQTELVLWDWHEPRAELYREMVKRYEAVRPDVRITVEVTPWDQFWTKLALAETTGVGPDITQFHNEQYPTFEGMLSPFPGDLFPPAQMASDYIMFNEAFNLDGHFYYMPAGIMTGAIFYNKDILADGGFAEVPSSWAEFLNMARKLTRISGDGKLEQAGFDAQELVLFVDLLYQHGGYLFGENGVTWGEAPGQEAISLYNEFFQSRVSPSPLLPLDLAFENGRAATKYNWTWYGGVLENADVDWDVAMIPTVTGDNLPARGRNNYEAGLAVPRSVSPERKRLAFEFIKWLYDSDEFVIRINDVLGRVPGKLATWSSPEVRGHKIMSTLAEQAPYTVYAGAIPPWTWEVLGVVHSHVFNQTEDPILALEDSVIPGNARFQELPPKWVVERSYQPPAQ